MDYGRRSLVEVYGSNFKPNPWNRVQYVFFGTRSPDSRAMKGVNDD